VSITKLYSSICGVVGKPPLRLNLSELQDLGEPEDLAKKRLWIILELCNRLISMAHMTQVYRGWIKKLLLWLPKET